MSDALDRILAGPFLRYTSPVEADIWFATSSTLSSADFVVEVWDPTFTGRVNYEPGGPDIVGASADPQTVQICPRLYVHVVRVSFGRPIQPNKVYAYRLVLDPRAEEPIVVEAPGIVDRVLDRRPLPNGAKKFASFVLGDATHYWLWGLPSQGIDLILGAADAFSSMVKHPSTGRASSADLQPVPSPTNLFLFGNPFTFSNLMPEAVLNAISSLAKKLCGSSQIPDDVLKSIYASANLLTLSPSLWANELGPLLAGLTGLTNCVRGMALLMSNIPTYILGTSTASDAFTTRMTEATGLVRATLNRLGLLANVFINSAFAEWPNTPHNSAPVVTSLDQARVLLGAADSTAVTFLLSGPPTIGCLASGDSIETLLGPGSIPDRIATVTTLDPMLRAKDGTWQKAPEMAAKHDITLALSMTTASAFIAEFGDPLGSAPGSTFGTSSEGILHGKVFELSASLGGARSTTPAAGISISVQQEVETARYTSLRRSGNNVSVSLEPLASSEKAFQVVLPSHGRLFEVQSSNPGLHLGNRFWTASKEAALAKGDRKMIFLKDVRVSIYVAGESTPRAFADADQDGWVDLNLNNMGDGQYDLKIEGTETTDNVGPDLQPPSGALPRTFKDRVWLKSSFPTKIVGNKIVSIDNEPIPSPTYRLLIDPAWMGSPRATSRTGRQVTLVVLHRTDSGGKGAGDAAGEATAWQYPSQAKKGAHYLMARDGTLIKCADESQSIGHAGADHLTFWNGRNAVNSFSIGIEIAKEETWDRFTEKQYSALTTFLRKFRATSRSDVNVLPFDIVGHSDFRLQERDGNHPIRLGDRNDPGLAFDWTRLEKRFLGLRRDDQENDVLFGVWVDPPIEVTSSRDAFNVLSLADRRRAGPSYSFAKKQVDPGPEWGAEIQTAIRFFDAKYPPGSPPLDIRKDLRQDLEDIGYLVPSTFSIPGADEIFLAAVQAFRSHFLSGPRRTYFQTKVDRPGQGETWGTIDPYVWSTEEEKEQANLLSLQGKLTVAWASQVAEYVRGARARADSNNQAYDGENGWKNARLSETADANSSAH